MGRPSDALGFLANITLFTRCFVHIDEAAGMHPPQLFSNAMLMAQLITSSSSRDMFRCEPDVSSYVSFWAYTVMEHFFVQLAKQSRANAVLRQVVNGDLENVPTDNHDLGMEAFNLGVKTYKMAMAGGVTLPEPLIYKNSDAKKKKMESALQLLGEPCKTIMEDFYIHNRSMQEICERFGYTNADNAKTQKYKCLQRLKKLFFQQQ